MIFCTLHWFYNNENKQFKDEPENRVGMVIRTTIIIFENGVENIDTRLFSDRYI